MRRVAALWLALVALWLLLVTQPPPSPRDPLPPKTELLDLRLDPKAWVVLQRAIARARELGHRDAAASVWVKGRLQGDGRTYPCKLRLRGDYTNHWSDAKVSLRVRLRGEERYRGARELNLIVAHDRAYFLEMAAEWWNRRLGLLPCPSRLVWVRINGEAAGAYALVEEPTRDLLEREGYPHAPLFRADGRHFRDQRHYWQNRRLVYSRAYYRAKLRQAPNGAQVARLLEEVLRIYREHPRPGLAELRRLSHLVDLDALARFSAACRLLGSHPEHPHNATLLFNAATGLFEPVLLDPEGLEARYPEAFDTSGYMLVFTRELLTLRAFRDRRDHHLGRVLTDLGAFLRTFDGYGRYLPLLERDPRLWLPDRSKQDPTRAELVGVGSRYKGFFEAARGVFERVLADPTRSLEPPPLEGQDSRVVHLVPRAVADGGVEVRVRHGRPTPLRLRALSLRGPGAGRASLRADARPADAGATRRWPFDPPLELPPGRDVVLYLRGLDLARQRLEVDAVDDQGPVPALAAPVSRDAGVHLAFLDEDVAQQAARLGTLRPRRVGADWVIDAGTWDLNGVLVVPRGGRLILEAGARLRFAPGASLLSYAPLLVRGTAERPVVCVPQDPARGWGVLAVLSTRTWSPTGPAERRSKVEHLVLRGARGATLNGVTYTGGLAFLGADVDVVRSTFDDVGGDDALNVKRGDAQVRECLFLRSPSDAIDLDWCTGRVERCLLVAQGGDGLDLCGARGVRVERNVILTAADKGVSVGERSRVELRENVLAGCAIGVASKDRSVTVSRDDTLIRCDRSFTAYRKKPIFGGGALLAERPRLRDAGEPWADARSRLRVQGAGPTPPALVLDGLRADPRRVTEAVLTALGRPELRADWPWPEAP